VRESSDNHPIIIRYFPGIIRFTQAICRFSSTAPKTNLLIFDRRNPRINRSGWRNRSVVAPRNYQIDSPVDRPSASPNRKIIVNRFPVIVNRAALNLSRIHQSRAPIHQFASESSTSRNQIRNRPVNLAGENIRNYPQPAWPGSATGLARIRNRWNLLPSGHAAYDSVAGIIR